jgi:predicted acetyltransferase
MSIDLRWVGEDELDRVALTRLRCYAKADSDLPRFKDWIRKDPRSKAGDFILAETDGQAVGTATHVPFQMYIRGGAVPCQGVAWVGAIKTMRRRGEGGTPGVASAVMHAMLRRARDAGDVVSALMPFRASYYEHFGYGVVERRVDWTIPIAALPVGPFDGVRFYESTDFAARAECLNRAKLTSQCDISRLDEYWKVLDETRVDSLQVVDRIGDGPVRGSMVLMHQQVDGRDIMKVSETIFENPAALKRQLHFLASLKDQFASVQLTMPADLPLNWLLKETQVPHRPVNHPVAEPKLYTRMQVRILDHAKFLAAMHLPVDAKGSVVVAVHECEGHISKFKIEINAGRATAQPSEAMAEFECPDKVWAAIACGDVTATNAVKWGLATGRAETLDILSRGPVPFCNEYF